MTAAAEAARILARDGASVILISDEAAEALARDEAAVALARESTAQVGEIGALAGAVAEWGDDQIAGGMPPKWAAARMITALRLIAAAARGEAATP